jgi:membrane protein CcdC involved in cytochrome C biogenesis
MEWDGFQLPMTSAQLIKHRNDDAIHIRFLSALFYKQASVMQTVWRISMYRTPNRLSIYS